jgi:hypothetical protein
MRTHFTQLDILLMTTSSVMMGLQYLNRLMYSDIEDLMSEVPIDLCFKKQEPNSSVTCCDGANERQQHD